jgi:hypothetical protein
MREQTELYKEHYNIAQEKESLPSKDQVDRLAKMTSDKDLAKEIRKNHSKESRDVNKRYDKNIDKAKTFYKDNEDALNDTARVEMEKENGVEKEKISKKSLKDKSIALLLGLGILAGAALGVGAVKGCENRNTNAAASEPKENEEITEENAPEEIGDEVEIELNTKRAEIEADRTYSFSQIVARINHYPDTVERNELLYWNINESAGQITVTRPYGELHEDNPHNEKVEFEFYPNDEQAIFEWNELDIRANLPAGAFWIETDTTGGKVEIEFFNSNGEVIKRHKGEMVMAEWTDKNGEKRHALQFRDDVTGQTRPASFQMFENKFDSETGKAMDIEYPYHTAKVTFEPTPGSRMTLKTGPTVHYNPDNPYGPDHDQGFGFYMWDGETETK